MAPLGTRVLFEHEGDAPEVGIIVEGHSVELVDGTRLPIQDGDYVDVIDRNTENWDTESLIVLAHALEACTRRRMRHHSL